MSNGDQFGKAVPLASDSQFGPPVSMVVDPPKTLPKSPTKMKAQPKMFTREWFKQKAVEAGVSTAEALPSAGATAGAIIGGTGGSAGGPMGVAAGGVGGAGVGGMGGEAAKQLLLRWMGFGGPPDPEKSARDITKAGLVQAGIQLPAEAMPALKGPLENIAETQYSRALAPTTKYMKATTQDIVPGLIERGEVGSLKSLEKRAGERAAELSPELTGEYKSLEAASPKLPVRGVKGMFQKGVTGQIPKAGDQVIKDLDSLKSQYMVKDAAGNLQVANDSAVKAIEGVQETVKRFGQNISPTSLRQLKHIFDEPVAQAGGYAGQDLATKYTLNAQEAAANSIRKILHSASPNISELDKEISFWLDVQLVTSRTLERQTGQAGGLLKVLGPLATAGASEVGLHYGGAMGGIEAGVGTATFLMAAKMIRSPMWRTASAVFKDRMATAVARNDVKQLSALATRLGISSLDTRQELEKEQRKGTN